jgi:hypothetical protein
LLIKRAKRLIQQDQARFKHERPRNTDALSHATGKLGRIGARKILEPHKRDNIFDPAFDFSALDALTP